ncbi:DUF1642 domain-containing protein [Enterococcus faecium]|nr:DUF1642 domain-containing protein [Enterococcus faecium]AGS76435.1 hypothetical protein EFAU085_02481 [Enterococcus faecium Aus0085]HAQ1366318.1 DUF1642 domain-containing protein [Enterococcus faecium Ef_RPH2]HAQ1383416.1 DUF1642 domain-containing protein [Enterococcus faecium Ef_aus0081]HAQ1391066.1 DUF1642 domain-containing protein [Enterococcus faecium Ef_aus0087]HAQ1583863.1 DUF1642 domain-containing protein [Enterococcus faecium Efm-HS0661]
MNKKVLIDKQALIDELMKIPGVGSNSDALETIKRFPSYEPQKPVVPKFVAELLDYYRQSTDVDLLALLITFHDWYYRKTKDGEHEEAIDWLVDHPEIYMRAWLFGYELEKEPLYCVIINGRYLVKVFSNTNVVILVPADEFSQYVTQKFQLTEKQIKAIDERYWPFAVPVDEVVEG